MATADKPQKLDREILRLAAVVVVGTIMAILDATVIRSLLVPALVRLFGRWNWWLPHPIARVLRVPPSPLRAAGAAAGGRQ